MNAILKRFSLSLLGVFSISFVLFLLSVLVLKSITPERVWNRESGGLVHLAETREKLSLIPEACKHDMNLIVGSSVSRFLEIKNGANNLNLSYAGPAPAVQKILLEELAVKLKECDAQKIKVFIEFLPYIYTEKNLHSFQHKNQLKLSYLLSWGKLLEDLFAGTKGTWEIMSYKARLNSAPEMMSAIFYSHLPGSNKSLTIEESIQMYDELSDIKELRFSKTGLTDFIEQINLLKKFSHSVVVYFPPSNPAWHFTKAGQKRLEDSFQMIQVQTGLRVNTFKNDFTASDFWDALHPTKSGMDKMKGELL